MSEPSDKISRNWTRENLAWLAGLFEGEGSININIRSADLRAFAVELASTDEDVIRKAHRIAGLGNVNGPRTLKSGKLCWKWSVTKKAHSLAICYAMYSWLCNRRKSKIQCAVATYEPARDTADNIRKFNASGIKHDNQWTSEAGFIARLADKWECSIEEAKERYNKIGSIN